MAAGREVMHRIIMINILGLDKKLLKIKMAILLLLQQKLIIKRLIKNISKMVIIHGVIMIIGVEQCQIMVVELQHYQLF